MSFYSIRRLDAALLRNPSLRDGDVRSAFGHNPNSFMYDVRLHLSSLSIRNIDVLVFNPLQKAYVSKNSSIDVQGMLLKGQQDVTRLKVSQVNDTLRLLKPVLS